MSGRKGTARKDELQIHGLAASENVSPQGGTEQDRHSTETASFQKGAFTKITKSHQNLTSGIKNGKLTKPPNTEFILLQSGFYVDREYAFLRI